MINNYKKLFLKLEGLGALSHLASSVALKGTTYAQLARSYILRELIPSFILKGMFFHNGRLIDTVMAIISCFQYLFTAFLDVS